MEMGGWALVSHLRDSVIFGLFHCDVCVMDMKLSPAPFYEYSGDAASYHISLSAGFGTKCANFHKLSNFRHRA